MTPFFAVWLALGLGALLFHLALKATNRRIENDLTPAVVLRAGSSAFYGFLRGCCLVALVPATIAVVMAGSHASVDSGDPAALAAAIATLEASVNPILSGMGIIVVAAVTLLVLGFALYVPRLGREHQKAKLDALEKAERSRLLEQAHAGGLSPLPETEPMTRIREQANEVVGMLRQVGKVGGYADLRAELTAQVEVCKLAYLAQDLERRISVEIRPEDVSVEEPEGAIRRALASLLGPRLFAALRTPSRVGFVGVLIGVMVCVWVGLEAMHASQAESRVWRLRGEQVAHSRAEAQASWEDARNALGTVSEPLTETDLGRIDEFAVQLEDEVAASNLFAKVRNANTAKPSPYELRSAAVATTILESGTPPDDPSRRYLPPLEHMPQRNPEAQQLLADQRRGQRLTPVTTFAGDIATDLREIAERSPEFRQRLAAHLSSRDPLPSGEAVRAARLASLADHAIGGASSGARDSRSAPLEGDVRAALQALWEARKARLLGDLASDRSIDETTARLRDGVTDRPLVQPERLREIQTAFRSSVPTRDQTRSLLRLLVDYPPSLAVREPPQVVRKKATEVLDALKSSLEQDGELNSPPVHLTDALVEYGDWFPPQIGHDRKTARGCLLERWTQQPMAETPSESLATATKRDELMSEASRAAFTRARNFDKIRGYFRVGGVVLGRAPESGGTTPGYRAIDWRPGTGGGLVLALTDSSGRAIESPEFDRALIRHALRYAADGRLLTVTMAKASPLTELRILIHPSLVDTPIGERVVEIDRFVDRFTGSSIPRGEASLLVESHAALYRYTWALRLLSVDLAEYGFDAEAATGLCAWTKEFLARQDLRHVTFGLTNAAAIGDPKRSPLTAKPEFFDPKVVALMRAAAKEADGLPTYRKQVRERARRQAAKLRSSYEKSPAARMLREFRSKSAELETLAERVNAETRYRDPALLRRAIALQDEVESLRANLIAASARGEVSTSALSSWTHEPPEFQLWSGVREMPYSSDVGSWIDASPAMTFRFMLQVAFTGMPQFLTGGPAGSESTYSDKQPWEFPQIEDHLQKSVLRSVLEGADDRDRVILRDVHAFTLLQRLFRMAFQGHLGSEFPIERLLGLSAVCSAATDMEDSGTVTCRTPRWNSREGSLHAGLLASLNEFLAGVSEHDLTRSEVQSSGIKKIRGCANLLSEYVGATEKLIEYASRTRERLEKRGSAIRHDPVWQRQWLEHSNWLAEWSTKWCAVADQAVDREELKTQSRRTLVGRSPARLLEMLDTLDRWSEAIKLRDYLGLPSEFQLSLESVQAPLTPLR